MREFKRLILASASRSRSDMLSAAGIVFDAIPADIDEEVIRAGFDSENGGGAEEVAMVLAEAKARCISKNYPDALIIGADQILTARGEIFSKADSLDDAKKILLRLRGQPHELVSSVVFVSNSEVLFRCCDKAELLMRNFSGAFLENYLERAGDALYDCVGCYELEGLGIQLFERVQGSYFTILGLPLLPLLEELRRLGVVLK